MCILFVFVSICVYVIVVVAFITLLPLYFIFFFYWLLYSSSSPLSCMLTSSVIAQHLFWISLSVSESASSSSCWRRFILLLLSFIHLLIYLKLLVWLINFVRWTHNKANKRQHMFSNIHIVVVSMVVSVSISVSVVTYCLPLIVSVAVLNDLNQLLSSSNSTNKTAPLCRWAEACFKFSSTLIQYHWLL